MQSLFSLRYAVSVRDLLSGAFILFVSRFFINQRTLKFRNWIYLEKMESQNWLGLHFSATGLLKDLFH